MLVFINDPASYIISCMLLWARNTQYLSFFTFVKNIFVLKLDTKVLFPVGWSP